MEDLKGKVLGVAGVRSVSDVSLRLLLTKYGLLPDVDVKIVSLAGSGIRLVSLQGGKIDGTLLLAPHNKAAVKLGFRELFSPERSKRSAERRSSDQPAKDSERS